VVIVNLYNKLREEQYFYCQGANQTVLKACCRYIEGVIGIKPYKTHKEITLDFDVSDTTLTKRCKKITKLLEIEWRSNKNFSNICDFCGKIFFSHSINGNCCCKCKRTLAKRIFKKWKKASICVCCGELNPLYLLPTGHHIFGAENSSIVIPICANCHELTKPRTRQGFFLFENFHLIQNKFTEDNSKIYVHID